MLSILVSTGLKQAADAHAAFEAEKLRQWQEAPFIPSHLTSEDSETIDGARAMIKNVLAALERVKLMSNKVNFFSSSH
jgi:hypothetical protein